MVKYSMYSSLTTHPIGTEESCEGSEAEGRDVDVDAPQHLMLRLHKYQRLLSLYLITF